MATSFWRGPDGTGRNPTSGNFRDAAAWVDGTVPGQDTDVYLGGEGYTVTLDQTSFEVESISIGAGATVHVTSNDQNAVVLVLDSDSVSYGTLDLAGGGVSVGASLVNYGVIHGIATSYIPTVYGGTVENFGSVTTDQSGGVLAFLNAIHNNAGGEITARIGAIYLIGSLINDGLVGAYGQTIAFDLQGHFGSSSNFGEDQLRGGRWEMLAGGTISLNAGGVIVDLLDGADVTLGAGAQFVARQDDGTLVSIEQSLRTVGDDAALHLVEGRSFGAANPVSIKGTLTLDGGTFTADRFTLDAGALLAGSGAVSGDATIAGHVVVSADPGATANLTLAGDCTFSGLATGRGTLTFSGGDATIDSHARIRTGGLAFDVSQIRLDAALSYKGVLTLDGSRLDIHADHLTLGKAAHLTDSTILGDTKLTLTHGATLTGACDVNTLTVARGRITVEGTTEFGRDVTGNARYVLADVATLVFDHVVSAAQVIQMSGAGTELRLGSPDAFAAHILRFGQDDTVVLGGIDASSRLAWRADDDGVGGTLLVFDTDGRIGLRFDDGAYVTKGFHLQTEAGGAASLTYTAPPHGLTVEAVHEAAFHPVEPLHALHVQLV